MPSVFPHAPLLIPTHFNISCCSWKFPFLKHHLFLPKATSLPTGVSQTEDSLKLAFFYFWIGIPTSFYSNTIPVCGCIYINPSTFQSDAPLCCCLSSETRRTAVAACSLPGSTAPSLPSPVHGLRVHQITGGHKSLPNRTVQGRVLAIQSISGHGNHNAMTFWLFYYSIKSIFLPWEKNWGSPTLA